MKIQIPHPCSEDFNSMTPQEKGRFCSHCQKCVIDFRSMDIKEIRSYLKENPDSCGTFYNVQLKDLNQIEPSQISIPSKNRWIPLGVLTLLGYFGQAQEKPNDHLKSQETVVNSNVNSENYSKDKTSNPNVLSKETQNTTPLDSIQKISGKFIDSDGFPVSNITVWVEGRQEFALSDLEGRFSIDAAINDTLIVNNTHEEKQKFTITSPNLGEIIVDYKGIEVNGYKIISHTTTTGVVIITEVNSEGSGKNSFIRVISFPYRKVRQWIRGY